jgi:hypothetical protein
MKFDDEIVLVSKKDGTFYPRRRRRDHVDPKKRSPALKYTLDRFRRANWNARGSRGFLWYGGEAYSCERRTGGEGAVGQEGPRLAHQPEGGEQGRARKDAQEARLPLGAVRRARGHLLQMTD